MARLLDTLTIRHKLALLCSAFLLPIGFLTYLFIAQTEKDVLFTAEELAGSIYFTTLRGELMAIVALSHGAASVGEVAEAQTRVLAQDSERAAEMSADAAAAKGAAAVRAVRAAAGPTGSYEPAIEAVLDHMHAVADGSNLTLDPDLDSSYAQDLVTVKMPAAIVAASRALDAALALLDAGALTPDATARFLTRKTELETALGQLKTDIDSGEHSNPDATMKPALDAAYREMTTRFAAYSALLETLAAPDGTPPGAAALRAAQLAAEKAATVFWETASRELEHLLTARVDGLNRRMVINLTLTAIVFFASIALAWGIVRSISRPLHRLHQTMHALALGDISVAIPDTARGDEIGVMAKDVEVFKQNAIGLTRLVEQVIASARQVAQATSQVAAAIRQSSEAITEVNQSTQSAHALSMMIADQVGESRDGMSKLADVVRGTADQARRVETMAASISQIAEQTNMLALNAAIEAARAGEQSRGFAVVAEEVRKLAEHSLQLAHNIGAVVRLASEESRKAVSVVGEVNDKIEAISEHVRRNDTLTARVATSMEQQQVSVAQIDQHIDALAGIAHSSAAAAEQVSVAMGQSIAPRPPFAAAGPTDRARRNGMPGWFGRATVSPSRREPR